MRYLYFSFWILLMLSASCTSKENTIHGDQNFQIEISDSLQIDYLGDLWIQDYDSISQEFVATTKNDQEFLIIDYNGKINQTLKIPQEGPNSILGVFSLSYRSGVIQVFDSVNGFHFFNKNGKITHKIPLPFQYYFISRDIGPTFYSLENKIAYPRPLMFDDIKKDGKEGILGVLYSEPLIEVLDTITNKTYHTMAFPQTSIYADGNYYFFPFPRIQKSGEKWYLIFANELKYFVYRESGMELVFEKTVDLNVKDAVLPRAEEFEVAMQYSIVDQRPASILQLFRDKGNTIVFYKKGVKEELVNNSLSDPSIELNERTFAAVFGEDNNLIQNEIEVPEGLIFSRAITEKGEILAKKNQDFFGTEEDQVVYYKLKITDSIEKK